MLRQGRGTRQPRTYTDSKRDTRDSEDGVPIASNKNRSELRIHEGMTNPESVYVLEENLRLRDEQEERINRAGKERRTIPQAGLYYVRRPRIQSGSSDEEGDRYDDYDELGPSNRSYNLPRPLSLSRAQTYSRSYENPRDVDVFVGPRHVRREMEYLDHYDDSDGLGPFHRTDKPSRTPSPSIG
ncbi:hypothetical protein F53441_8556 [Fusarium austroafricanum]|uniref:Uncharacterized protein n=1 Tax=Fusarium austroafricanum TaxID=2364996 RepID=A0A8H4KD08_9HYPO|nr:hypothetical protein F53441_8556 [Fusarium austroafricanum]